MNKYDWVDFCFTLSVSGTVWYKDQVSLLPQTPLPNNQGNHTHQILPLSGYYVLCLYDVNK